MQTIILLGLILMNLLECNWEINDLILCSILNRGCSFVVVDNSKMFLSWYKNKRDDENAFSKLRKFHENKALDFLSTYVPYKL